VNKKIITKSVLVLIVIALLTMGFTGCAPMSATVTVITHGSWYYDVYMDYTWWGQTDQTGTDTIVIYNVPIGTHFFEAVDTWGWTWGYDSTTQYIHAGANYVHLYP